MTSHQPQTTSSATDPTPGAPLAAGSEQVPGHATSPASIRPVEVPSGLPATRTQTVSEPLKTRVRAPVVHEVIKEIEEIRITPVVEREVVKVEIQQIIQPIRETVRLEPVVERLVLPSTVRDLSGREVQEKYEIDQTEILATIARFRAEREREVGGIERKVIGMPARVSETTREVKVRETIPVMVQEGAPNLAEKRHLHPELLPTSTSTSMGTMGLEGERGVGIGRTEAFQAGAEPGEVAEAIGTPGQATTGATGAMRATGAKEAITPSPSVRGGEVGPAVGGPETPIAGQQVSGSSASGSAMATRTPVTAESSIPSQAAPVSTGTATTTREPPILGTASEPKMHPTRNEPAEWSSDETSGKTKKEKTSVVDKVKNLFAPSG